MTDNHDKWYYRDVYHSQSDFRNTSRLSVVTAAEGAGGQTRSTSPARGAAIRRRTRPRVGPTVLVLVVVVAAVAWAVGPAAASETDGRAVAASTRAGEPAQPEDPGPKGVELPARRSYADQVARETGLRPGEASPRSGATGVVPNLPYSNWSWGASGYGEISETLTVTDADPRGHYYWAHSFVLQGGDQGYSGLQVGSAPHGSKIALFAIWGATAAEGPSCRTFDNEGSGWTCRVDPYQWVTGRPYELRTVRDEVTAEGTWIKATIIDVVTGAVTEIGRIRVPPTWGAMVGFRSWTEWFGPGLATCAAFARSRVAWDVPRGTAEGGRIDAPVARGTMVGVTNPIQACPGDTFITAGARGADVQTITPTPWAPSSSWSALVDRQYQDVVGRAPTATERATWVPDLTSGRRRPGEVVAALRRSRDNATFVDPVARLYHAYFQRQPDPGGLSYWATRAVGAADRSSPSPRTSPCHRSSQGSTADSATRGSSTSCTATCWADQATAKRRSAGAVSSPRGGGAGGRSWWASRSRPSTATLRL